MCEGIVSEQYYRLQRLTKCYDRCPQHGSVLVTCNYLHSFIFVLFLGLVFHVYECVYVCLIQPLAANKTCSSSSSSSSSSVCHFVLVLVCLYLCVVCLNSFCSK